MGTTTLSRRRVASGAFVLALCALLLLGDADRAKAAIRDFVPGQVIVRLESDVTTIEQINARYGTTTLRPFADDGDIYLLRLPRDSGVLETVTRMSSDEELLYAEPNFVAQTPEGDARHRAYGISKSEPSPGDHAAAALNLASAHDVSRGEGTTVAVLDTGAQLDHPALEANFAGVRDYDFVGEDTDPSDGRVGADADRDGVRDDMFGHGTHVAGILDRVAPAARIVPLRVLDSEGYGNVFAIARAVSYAGRNGSDVINLSLGTPSRSRLLGDVIEAAIEDGAVVAGAAGNSNSVAPHYPAAGDGASASADGLVAVTSVSPRGRKSGFANYGLWVDIAAPGENIRSAYPTSVYATWSGTSMSTPFVSGQAALIHATHDSLDPAGVEERMRCSARSLVRTDPVHAALLGAGHADVGGSLEPDACV